MGWECDQADTSNHEHANDNTRFPCSLLIVGEGDREEEEAECADEKGEADDYAIFGQYIFQLTTKRITYHQTPKSSGLRSAQRYDGSSS